MRVGYLRPIFYFGGLVLVLLLPISIEWRVLLFGEKTMGMAVPIEPDELPAFHTGSRPKYAVAYYAEHKVYRNYNLGELANPELGEPYPIKFLPEHPENSVVFTFSGIYTGWNLVVLLMSLLFWMLLFHFRQAKNVFS